MMIIIIIETGSSAIYIYKWQIDQNLNRIKSIENENGEIFTQMIIVDNLSLSEE